MEKRKICTELVNEYLKEWNERTDDVLKDECLELLFRKLIPNNTKTEEILTKVCTLNRLYSTNIYNPMAMARHIKELNIDERLRRKGENDSLVEDIANIEVSGKKKRFYSFATKYCYFHSPDDFPIYDLNVKRALMTYYKDKGGEFSEFTEAKLRDYKEFRKVLKAFAKHYGIDSCSVKELDKFLWLLGLKLSSDKT